MDRRDDWLIGAIPRDRRKVYDMRKIVRSTVDTDSFFEFSRKYGGSAITGLARLDGWPVAVLASDPYHYGGGWTATPRSRSPASSISPTPSICPWSISSMCRGF